MKHDFTVSVKTRTGETPRIFTKQQYIIWKFFKDPEGTDWPREIKIANQLFKKYSDFAFWRALYMDFKLNSLAYFLTGNGKIKLDLEYRKFKLSPKESVVVEILEDKIGEDVTITKKKTLFDLLK